VTACLPSAFLLCLFFHLEDGGEMFLQNVGLLSAGLEGVISEKKELFNENTVR
jgi:hypothetical protein